MKKKQANGSRRGAPADRLIDEALNQAARDAIQQHKAAGQPLVVWKDGKTVLIPPDEVESQENGQNRDARHK